MGTLPLSATGALDFRNKEHFSFTTKLPLPFLETFTGTLTTESPVAKLNNQITDLYLLLLHQLPFFIHLPSCVFVIEMNRV